MSEIHTFKIEEKFEGIDELYEYLIKNVDFIEDKIGLRIGEEGLSERPFCITGKEKITERQILFYASENTLPENVGEMILLADAFKADVVVFIVEKINPTILSPMNWLNNICNEDTKFILGEVDYKQALKQR